MRKYKAVIRVTIGQGCLGAGTTQTRVETYTCGTCRDASKKAAHSVLRTNAHTLHRAELVSLEVVKEG